MTAGGGRIVSSWVSGNPMEQTCDIEIRVRYPECDPMGLVHHARYLEYLEMGRTELLRRWGFRYRDLEARGVFFVIVHVDIRYRVPARYDDTLVLTTSIARQTRARIDHEYTLTRDGRVLAEATTTVACVDREGRPIPIPDEILKSR
jgi:acyl-CoA thioester hydrolase